MWDLKFTSYFDSFAAQILSIFWVSQRGRGPNPKIKKCYTRGRGVSNIDFLSKILFEWPLTSKHTLNMFSFLIFPVYSLLAKSSLARQKFSKYHDDGSKSSIHHMFLIGSVCNDAKIVLKGCCICRTRNLT